MSDFKLRGEIPESQLQRFVLWMNAHADSRESVPQAMVSADLTFVELIDPRNFDALQWSLNHLSVEKGEWLLLELSDQFNQLSSRLDLA